MFSANGLSTRLFVTHACILSSATSSRPPSPPSSAHGMLPYHPTVTEVTAESAASVASFSPVTLSAHDYSTSELLRTLSRYGCF